MNASDKRKRQFPGATPYTDRHGKRRWRYRKGAFSAELGSDYDSDGFVARYEAAVQGQRVQGQIGVDRTVPMSVSALVASFYRTPTFRNLAPSSQHNYRRILERFREGHGPKRVTHLERRHVINILGEKADTPSAANNLRKRLNQVFDHAVDIGWIAVNPVRATRPYTIEGGGHHTWTEEEIDRFLAHHPEGTAAHRAMTLMLYTGAARVDAVKLGRGNLRDDRIEYRRQKTAKSTPVLISIPVHAELAKVIDATPPDAFTFLETAQGKARSAKGLGTAMRTWCDAAGLPGCSAHGLRKAIARRLAEAGATANQIAAVTGHKTLSEVQRYTAEADRRHLADVALEKMGDGTKRNQRVTNLSDRFAKKGDK